MIIVDRAIVAKALNDFCDKFDTYSEAAKKLGITLSQLSGARNNPKSVIPAKACKKLGFEYAAVYTVKEGKAAKKPAKPKVAKAGLGTFAKPSKQAVAVLERSTRLPAKGKKAAPVPMYPLRVAAKDLKPVPLTEAAKVEIDRVIDNGEIETVPESTDYPTYEENTTNDGVMIDLGRRNYDETN